MTGEHANGPLLHADGQGQKGHGTLREPVALDGTTEKSRVLVYILQDHNVPIRNDSASDPLAACITATGHFRGSQAVGVGDAEQVALVVLQDNTPAIQPEDLGHEMQCSPDRLVGLQTFANLL